MPDWTVIPLSTRRLLDRLSVDVANAYLAREWKTMLNGAEEIYRILLEAQEQHEIRLSKARPLYSAGVALVNLSEHRQAIERFVQSYVEELLDTPLDDEDQADWTLAARALAIVPEWFAANAQLKIVVRRRKASGQAPRDPDALVQETLTFVSSDADELIEALRVRQRDIRTALVSDRRCFVGGNYFAGGPNLEDIRRTVTGCGYDAIVVADFLFDPAYTHRTSLMLLHLCQRAVFEVTQPAGQLMELERCRDYEINPLLVRQILPRHDPIVSQMIGSMSGVSVRPYSTIDELRSLVLDYLMRP